MNYIDFRVRKERILVNFYIIVFFCWLVLMSLVSIKRVKFNRLFKISVLIFKFFL